MQRLKGRSIVFGALAVLACSGDPTGNESTPTVIQANPDVVFVTQGDSEAVIVSVADEDGQILQSDPTISNVGGGITVNLDPTYQAVTTGNPIRRQTRFFVKGVDLTTTSFTINALGLTKDVAVTSIPGALAATVSDSLPALGDTISLTAPAGTFFSDTSVLSFDGAVPQVVSQDATTITFIPFPNIDGPAVVSNVGVTSNSTVVFNLATPYRIKTDSIFDLGTAVTPTTPALGGTVTLTLPTDLRLIPESLVTLNIANQAVLPRDATISADSTTITFVPPPNADSFVVLSGVVHRNLPFALDPYRLTLNTTVKVTTPVIANVPSTVNTTAPAGGASVTLTSTDGAFTFSPETQVVVGADTATTTAVTTSSVTFVPTPGASGPLTATNVVVAGFPLPLPSTAPAVTAGTTVAPIAGTSAPGTAPTLTIPGAGITRGFVDAVPAGYAACGDGDLGVPCQIYKFTVAVTDTFDIEATWEGTSDVGIYILESDALTDFGIDDCDSNGNGDTAQPEVCTQILPPGTYFLAVAPFGPFYDPPEANPQWVKVRINGD